MSIFGDLIKGAVDSIEDGVDKISKKTIGEIGADIVEGAIDAGTAVKKKAEEIGKEISKGL